jgi:hypothetical protein
MPPAANIGWPIIIGRPYPNGATGIGWKPGRQQNIGARTTTAGCGAAGAIATTGFAAAATGTTVGAATCTGGEKDGAATGGDIR